MACCLTGVHKARELRYTFRSEDWSNGKSVSNNILEEATVRLCQYLFFLTFHQLILASVGASCL